jgi:uncharacterized protein (DUF1697 family)
MPFLPRRVRRSLGVGGFRGRCSAKAERRGRDVCVQSRYDRGITTVFIALLRGINMGGHKKLAMRELRAVAEELGCEDVRTLLNSGNMVFKSRSRAESRIDPALEMAIYERFGIKTGVMIRSADEWKKIVTGNPFVEASKKAGSRIAVTFFKDKPQTKNLATLKRLIAGSDNILMNDREIYVFFPEGFAKAGNQPPFAKILQTDLTARSWSTVVKIAGMVE